MGVPGAARPFLSFSLPFPLPNAQRPGRLSGLERSPAISVPNRDKAVSHPADTIPVGLLTSSPFSLYRGTTANGPVSLPTWSNADEVGSSSTQPCLARPSRRLAACPAFLRTSSSTSRPSTRSSPARWSSARRCSAPQPTSRPDLYEFILVSAMGASRSGYSERRHPWLQYRTRLKMYLPEVGQVKQMSRYR